MTTVISPPDLSARPLQMATERSMTASPAALFRAWTEGFDRWLAEPGSLLVTPQVNGLYFFQTAHGGLRVPYYGRFLRLEPDRLVELTWVSLGTRGFETVVTIELTPHGTGTTLRLTQSGFPDAELRDAHDAAWPTFLAQLDERMTAGET
jgi:uncharacterized protein YndB with AHSA1/START domain